MKIPPKHPKLRGEWAETHFLARASEHGLSVAKPYGDCRPYDFIVESNGRMFRVQVKATSKKNSRCDSYVCRVRPTARKRDHFEVLEFLAAYLIPEDLWYIIPYTVLTNKRNISLNPRSQRNAYRTFREAWDLLIAESRADVRRRRRREKLTTQAATAADRPPKSAMPKPKLRAKS